MEQWEKDGTFNAEPGQEVSKEVYNAMLNAMQPKKLPHGKAMYALQSLDIPVHSGFLMGEPYTCVSDKEQLYLAFGMNDYGKGKHYYYLGLSAPDIELNGTFYYFDCMSTPPGGKLYDVAAFDGDNDAIKTAANYEATLYKYEYKNDEITNSITLYDPFNCFE